MEKLITVEEHYSSSAVNEEKEKIAHGKAEKLLRIS